MRDSPLIYKAIEVLRNAPLSRANQTATILGVAESQHDTYFPPRKMDPNSLTGTAIAPSTIIFPKTPTYRSH